MQFSKSRPLPLRLLAFRVTSSFLITLWICLQPQHLVCATEIPVAPEHVQRNEIEQSIPHTFSPIDAHDPLLQERGTDDDGYVPDFAYFDRSLIGRQEAEVIKLENNKPHTSELAPEKVAFFRFEKGTGASKRDENLSPGSSLDRLETKNTSGRSISEDTVEEKRSDEELLLEETPFENSLDRRQNAARRIWISANTCRQPIVTIPLMSTDPPKLTLYISSSEQRPGPNTPRDQLLTDPADFVKGFANFTTETDGDLFIGVSSPVLTSGWDGSWSFEVAASLDGSFHNFLARDYLYMVDTDSDSALFVTFNLTTSNSTADLDKWKNGNPFTMYAFPANANSSRAVIGLEHSYCGLKSLFNTTNNISVSTTITTKFGGGRPKAQFNVQGLKMDEEYTGFLAVDGANENLRLPLITDDDGDTEQFVVRGGGQVFAQWKWRTKADDSCQVIQDLEFCDNIAYAVPSSSAFKQNDAGLMKLYDDLAKSYYQNFTNSLDQIACETTSTAQYSLARNCDDCRRDYKDWLCSVVFPRCEDYGAQGDWLHARNINTPFANGSIPHMDNLTAVFNSTFRDRFAYNRSRVPMIDDQIKPGPYKELLPCDYLCHNIVRSCPAILGFACPEGEALEHAYGEAKKSFQNLTCNFPGAVKILNRAVGASPKTVGIDPGVVMFAVFVVGLFGIL
ncbi:hypothetical protein DM02DRAFT_3878 [Periconia macrospinosa]|uniref:Calcium channel subunit Mid1 n=1 Tax=Periconia macrospinosa TaxID=97972 RepID=A0A2V1EEG8_9PLEO|nr:hypothetical protein DM02DRAFT_3878 [Periconia macrospinosa]